MELYHHGNAGDVESAKLKFLYGCGKPLRANFWNANETLRIDNRSSPKRTRVLCCEVLIRIYQGKAIIEYAPTRTSAVPGRIFVSKKTEFVPTTIGRKVLPFHDNLLFLGENKDAPVETYINYRRYGHGTPLITSKLFYSE